jgi:hypothetical protein
MKTAAVFSGRPDHAHARRGPAVFFLLLLFQVVASPAYALPPHRLTADPPPALRAADGDLVEELSIAVDNEPGLRDLLKDGAILELEISASVERVRSILGNADLGQKTYLSVIRHDPLSREFLLTVPDAEKSREMRDKNLSRLLHAGWKNLALPVIPLKTMRDEGEDEEFVVKLRITLQHADVPPWLRKNFVFWSSEVAPPLNFDLPFVFGDSATP